MLKQQKGQITYDLACRNEHAASMTNCVQAFEWANMDVEKASRDEAITETLGRFNPLNSNSCSPGTSCHYFINVVLQQFFGNLIMLWILAIVTAFVIIYVYSALRRDNPQTKKLP